jgi:hypothetical protein
MSTRTDHLPTAAAAPPPPKAPLSRRQKITRVAVVAVVLGIVVMWIYAFGFASKRAAAAIEDKSWTTRAEQICETRNDLLKQNAIDAQDDADPGTPETVGRRVARATDLIEATLDEVVAVRPTGEEDLRKVAEFERLYRIYIADRRAAEVKLKNGEAAELNETTLNGSPLSDSINDITNPNRMTACAPPVAF